MMHERKGIHALRAAKPRATLALVLAPLVALSASGVARAHHTDCTAQGSSDPSNQVPNACPEFSPGFDLTVDFPFRDAASTINLEMSQADHEASALAWEWFLPKEWLFNTSIRPAERATGGAASSCNDLFDAAGDAPRAEAVSIGNLMRTRSFTDRRTTDWKVGKALRALYFWKSSGSTTTLCFQFRTNRSSNAQRWTSSMTLERINLGASSPYGWKVTVPIETLQAQSWFNAGTPTNAADDHSLIVLDLELGWLTSGTWHLENGIPTKTVFSRAPRNPIRTRIGTRAIACTNGADTLAACSEPGNQGFPIAYPYEGLREFPLSVMLPPIYGPMPWAKIAGAGDTNIPGRGRYYEKPVKGFGFSDNLSMSGNLLSVRWRALASDDLPSGVRATGYVLAVHKITSHQSPDTADEIAAGRVLFARDFSNADSLRSISFDLMDMPENRRLGTVDGKYNVSLVTVYDMALGTGYRSDGLCDGPTSGSTDIDNGQGVLCPPDRPLWMADGSGRDDGTSLFQVLARGERWPRRYLSSAGGQPFGVLLLDIAAKKAEYTIWGATETASPLTAPTTEEAPAGNVISPIVDPFTAQTLAPINASVNAFISSFGGGIADQGPATAFRATSDLMFEPTGPAGGVVKFGNFDLENEGFTWDFTASISSAGAVTRGRFTMYNAKGADLDWVRLSVDPDDPGTALDPSHGGDCPIGAIGCPSGTPRFIVGDFNGTAF